MPLGVLRGATPPHAGEHEVPPCVRAKVTPPAEESFRTVAVNCCLASSGIRPEPGETETVIAGTVTVI